ncbi:MAG: DUF2304 domain-containing protein [Rothia sp. (in: high G+C Gram-positive bacteria)]|uniref:DUF2304 domain-containing protein n=1 Tax=Rothia sp. (in: high G+C Gram-positive bacteria) TaxID=1885016 RepID=UPI0026E05AB1|nr:DUF2304 domain-containing protein [Rothia sp. (in: high G+C Gram-positive bacteria)]MDO5749639.1 DUF2304 domain-containing protein [Rothia sp. (in: high G+C Gram-positive bacteria)]
MSSNVFFLILALCISVLVIAQVRTRKMHEKYAFLWLSVSAVIIVLGAFPNILNGITTAVGIATPVNLLFLLSIMLLIGVCLHLTLELTSLSEKNRVLAEEVAIIKARLRQGESGSSAEDTYKKTSETLDR